MQLKVFPKLYCSFDGLLTLARGVPIFSHLMLVLFRRMCECVCACYTTNISFSTSTCEIQKGAACQWRIWCCLKAILTEPTAE